MRDAPPPASLRSFPDGETWVCYYCETWLLTLSQLLAEERLLAEEGYAPRDRVITQCENCGRLQVVGTDEDVKRAAAEADREQPRFGPRDNASQAVAISPGIARALEQQALRKMLDSLAPPRPIEREAPSLPDGLSGKTLAALQKAYDELKNKHGQAPKSKVADFAGVNRNTAASYWPFIKK